MMEQLTFDQDTWSGKMSPELSVPIEERTSELSSKKQQKSQMKMPLFLNLQKVNGQPQDALWETDGASLGEFSMHSFGESPKEDVESHLSQILEANPHQRYSLSDKACLGILNRANRRGKQLPQMLEEALIQKVVEETEYGQKGIADTIEILREMRHEVGEACLKEWVQRTFVLVQPEEVLLGEMCEPCEDSEDSNEQIVVKRNCEEINGEKGMCEMWGNGEAGDSPQRREPNEQLTEQLDLLMQKLPHENAQKAVIMYCLRTACEGEESVYEALPAISKGETARTADCIGVDIYNTTLTGDKTCPLTAEGHGSTGTCPKVMTAVNVVGVDGYNQTATGGVSKPLTSSATDSDHTPIVVYSLDRASFNQGQNAQFDFEVSDKGINSPLVAKGPSAVCYTIDQGGGKSACNVAEGQAPTLTCTHGGEPAVCYPQVADGIVGTLDAHYVNTPGMRGETERTIVYGPTSTRYTVRRLTPLECERLQGFPDGWTDIGDWTDTKGKVRKTSDAARYKALGNSIALPPWKWVIKRLCACYERDATMASLFDGIGGFPYIWEQINGKGSCLWASEIEEFPMAVTKERIR